MSKDILPVNKEGKWDGYCENYWDGGSLNWKGVYVNGEAYGYFESYRRYGIQDDYTAYWLKNVKVSYDNKEGYCYIWNKYVVVSKDILPMNAKGQPHGYCERYHPNGQLMWKGACVNDKWYGYIEYYWEDGSALDRGTGYFLNHDRVSGDNEKGYCYMWDKEKL